MLLTAIASAPLRAQTPPYTGMVVFGDDFSDVGNMSTATSILGESYAQYLTGFDPNYYYNYRFSNGPIWADQLYTSLGFGPIGTLAANDGAANINGTNFAWAESRSGAGTVQGIFENLQLQVGTYSTQLANSNPALPAPSTTLFSIWSGANDVIAYVESGDPVTPDQVANNIALAITALYAEGGRFFLVPNMLPFEKIPGYISDPIKGELAAEFVDDVNSLLDAKLDELSASLDGITIFKLDVNSLYLDILADSEAFGFTNVTDTAYIRYGNEPYMPTTPPYGELAPNSDGYFYWDATHGTTATNALIASAAYQTVDVPEPAAGLLVLGAGFTLLFLGRNRLSKFCSNN